MDFQLIFKLEGMKVDIQFVECLVCEIWRINKLTSAAQNSDEILIFSQFIKLKLRDAKVYIIQKNVLSVTKEAETSSRLFYKD